MNKRKIIGILLAVLMVIAVFSGCKTTQDTETTKAPAQTSQDTSTAASEAEETPETVDPFAEPVHFTAATFDVAEGTDLATDRVYQFLSEKFNCTFELYPLTWDNWQEKNRLWITAGDMPGWTFWNFSFTEYVSYAEQGLIGALPAGWETDYVNLSQMIEATGIKDKINLDGKTYAVPKVIFYLFAPIKKAINHASLYYRADWLEQLGMEFGDLITLEQMEDYLTGCMNQGFVSAGLSGSYDELTQLFVQMKNSKMKIASQTDHFYKKDGKYVWGPGEPETLEGIKLFKEYYDKGVIDPDFYLNEAKEYRNEFNSTLLPMVLDGGTVDQLEAKKDELVDANPDLDKSAVTFTNVVAPDGLWHGTAGSNYWASIIFNPNLEDSIMARMMAFIDFVCTEDGQLLAQLGIEGVDWERAADGSYTITREQNEDGTYTDLPATCTLMRILAILPDDFNFVKPGVDPMIVDTVIRAYTAKAAGDIADFDPDYSFFISDAKSAYSVDVASEIVRIIIEGADIDTEWAAFVEAQAPIYQPVLDDLNSEFAD